MRSRVITLIVMLIVPTLALSQDVPHSSAPSSRLHAINPQNPQDLRELFRYTGESLHFVSAHRGGPRQNFPENCIATFENTLQHTFAIMEIDPRYTKDGVIVVHHDATLERTTNGKGRVAELTLEELKELRLKDTEGIVTEFQIPTLDDVLQWARCKTILVLDQKDVPVEVRARKIGEHRAEAYAMLIVYSFKDARKCYELNKNIMMEVMIPNREQFYEFEKTGIPWSNIIAFVGHTPPKDKELFKMIHAKGACCMAGTSRNLDREYIANRTSGTAPVEQHYRALLQIGADVIETDIPRKVGKLLYSESAIPASKSPFFQRLHF
ncbi:MAG: glycerophosphodiester phosphodiesterase family protein [Planctomycetes bacterium]|nr:glycerophosphodiester phosphodiesterase family protein [Planctomycetota bacterium]